MTFEDFQTHLEGVQEVPGGIVALCPAHKDTNPSLAVSEGNHGLLVYCRSHQCAIEDIMRELGLPMTALFYDDRSIAPRQPVAIYSYVDEEGRLLYQQLRFPPKDFRSRHLGPDGKWIWNLQGCRKVLYNLKSLVTFPSYLPVFFVEGEKDADSLIQRGYIATTCLGGAKKFQPNYVKYFLGKDVRIIQDKDEPGREHGDIVWDALEGVAGSVTIYEAAWGKDVTDHLEAGFTVEELKEIT